MSLWCILQVIYLLQWHFFFRLPNNLSTNGFLMNCQMDFWSLKLTVFCCCYLIPAHRCNTQYQYQRCFIRLIAVFWLFFYIFVPNRVTFFWCSDSTIRGNITRVWSFSSFFLISPMSNFLPVYRITSNWYWVWSHPLYFESCLKYNKQKIWRILQQLQNKETQTNNKQRKITIHGRCKHYISQAL